MVVVVIWQDALHQELSAETTAVKATSKDIGKLTVWPPPPTFSPHCSKANSYVSQCWTIQMRQAKSYLAFRCEIPKYIIHVILFAKGCISSTHYSCSYRSIISCCKWYRKYAYCYISRQTCRISPLWLSANDDVSITSPPITGIFGVISYSYASKAKVGYTNAKTVV